MKEGSRVKVSVSLPAELVAEVDREVRVRPGASRSAVVEEWLRQGARLKAEGNLRAAVVAYYRELRTDERVEEEALARGLSRAGRRLWVDDVRTGSTRKKRR
jgi:metal-responsive CopG/Arc/MetJ family transcriptional regulator